MVSLIHKSSHSQCSHSLSHRVFSLILTHVLPITVIPVVLTLTSLVFSQSVLSECSHSHSHTNSSHSHMLSLILSHRVFSLILSHQLIHTNSLILSQSVPTLLVLHTHVIPDTLSQSVLTLHSHTHHTHNDLSSTSHYTLVAPLDPPYHPNQFNQEDGINLKDSLDKASSYPHSTHFILSRLQKIAQTIPFHSIPYKSFSFIQKE